MVSTDANGTISSTYSPTTLSYDDTKMLVFASKFDMGIGSFDRLKTANAQTTVATFLVLHGTIGAMAYAQSIPFVSLYYS